MARYHKMNKEKTYEVIIIGSGPAGLQASIYTARAGLKTAIFGKKESSRSFLAHTIDNLLGFPEGIEGSDLLEKGISEGYTLPKAAVANVPDQIKGQIPSDYKKSIYYLRTWWCGKE